MRIVVDAMATESGGIRTYVDNLLRAWSVAFPGDELHVLVPTGSTLDVGVHARHDVVVRRPGSLWRPVAVTRAVRRVVADVGADAVLATLPSTVLRDPGAPMAVVVHDLRHELRPEQFTASRRLLRRVSYERGYALADVLVAISERTAADLASRPRPAAAPVAVVPHGADHALAWPVAEGSGPAVAFAHHTNKNPELVIDAWALLRDRGTPRRLVVLGVRGPEREGLQQRIDDHDLGEWVSLSGYLSDPDYLGVVADAQAIVFPTDFEGFGLPVLEAMMMGTPIVIGPEPACLEVAGGHAHVAEGWTATDLADAVERADAATEADLDAAREWAAGFTWERTARATREALQQASDRRRR